MTFHNLQEQLCKARTFGELLAIKYGDRLEEQGRDLLERMQCAAKRISP